MQYSSCDLLSLPDEVIVEILTYCTVEEVLGVANTCKQLCLLCHTRSIWLAKLQTLDINQAPNFPPYLDFQSLSASDLREKVIKAIRSAYIWQGRVVVAPRIDNLTISRQVGAWRVEARLLPGGDMVLLETDGMLQLWSINSRKCLWTSPTDRGEDVCMSFDFEPVNGGKELMVAGFFFRRHGPTTYIRVFSFDFLNNEGKLVIERIVPAIFLFRLMIRGDIVMVHIPHECQIMLINWRARSGVMMDFMDSIGKRVNARGALIVDQHLVVVLDTNISAMVALPLSLLAGHWSQSAQYAEWDTVTYGPDAFETGHDSGNGLGCTLRLPLYEGEDGPLILAFNAYTPVWRGPGAPAEIHFVAFGNESDSRRMKRLFSWRIQLSRTTSDARQNFAERPHLELIAHHSAIADTLPWNPDCITNSGRMFSLREGLLYFSLFTDTPQPCKAVGLGTDVRIDDEDMMVTAVEPWSGSIVIGTPGLVRIVHFD